MDTGEVEDKLDQPPRPAPLKLDSYLPHRLDVLSDVVSHAFSPVYTNVGLTLPEWRVLATLGTLGELTGKQVSGHTGTHKSAVSRIAHTLVARHLIEMRANPGDLRSAYLRLTAQGQQVFQEGSPLLVALAHRLDEAIEPADREPFYRTLRKLTERAKSL